MICAVLKKNSENRNNTSLNPFQERLLKKAKIIHVIYMVLRKIMLVLGKKKMRIETPIEQSIFAISPNLDFGRLIYLIEKFYQSDRLMCRE